MKQLNKLPMKRSRLRKMALPLAFALLCSMGTHAQISFPGTPEALKCNLKGESLRAYQVKIDRSVDELKMEDELNRNKFGTPPKVAQAIETDLDLARDGEWTITPDGKAICRMRVSSENAVALMFSYSDFYIPEGAELYIYNLQKNHVLGAYTTETNPQGGAFATEMVAGDDVIFEYVTPSKDLLPRVKIDNLGFCYNNITLKYMARKANKKGSVMDLEVGESGSCMININCDEGLDWQTEKKGVARMMMYLSNGSGGRGWYLCSGTLVNNTKQDLTPYLLSAHHCYDGTDEENDFPRWMFYFHYESPGCESVAPERNYTVAGCVLRAAIPLVDGSDGLLLELTQDIPQEWDVYYNGWDRRNSVVSGEGVCIHHPAGDIKKISVFNNYSSYTWYSDDNGAEDGHWLLSFIRTQNGAPATQGGSSGSPMFTAEHLVTGTLTGGNSSCTNPYGSNYYGKLWFHWDQYGNTAATQMKTWLDPIGAGLEVLNGTSFNPTSPRITIDDQELYFNSSVLNEPSDVQVITLTAFNLESVISVVADDNFAVSNNGESWSRETELAAEGGELYVCYMPSKIGNHQGKLTISNNELSSNMYVSLTASSCPQLSLETQVAPTGKLNDNYYFAYNAEGGVAPYKYKLVQGRLPRGIYLDADGVISGLTDEPGLFDFTISVTDANDCSSVFESSLYMVCMVVDKYPYQQSFESYATLPGCWLQQFMVGYNDWTVQSRNTNTYDYPENAANGQNNVLFMSEDYEGKTTMLITPQLDLSTLESPKLSFWHIQQGWFEDQDELRVYYKNTPSASWKLLKEFTEDITDWQQVIIELPESSDEYFIGFEGKSNYGYGIGLDEVSVYGKDGATAIIENYFDGIQLDYNAVVDDYFTLSWSDTIESVQLMNALGETVYMDNHLAGKNQIAIPAAGWSTGVYLVKLHYQYATHIFKLIKK